MSGFGRNAHPDAIAPDPPTRDAVNRLASGLTGRHAKRFRPAAQAHRLAERITDFSPLLALPAFQSLDRDLTRALRILGV